MLLANKGLFKENKFLGSNEFSKIKVS